MNKMFADIEKVCCYGPDGPCVCSTEEAAMRRYTSDEGLRPMTEQEREWCVYEADKCGEGYYSRDELTAKTDVDLAHAVLDAWNMYVQSNCL